MNTFKYNAFLSEFPFLDKALRNQNGEPRSPKTCDSISVKRITWDILKTQPSEYSWDGSLVGIHEWERVDFVLAASTFIEDAVATKGKHGSNYAHEGQHDWEGETVLEAINRHGVASTLGFIVWTRGGYNVVEHYSEPNWSAVIYKPSKDLSLAQAVVEATAKAVEEVQTESAF